MRQLKTASRQKSTAAEKLFWGLFSHLGDNVVAEDGEEGSGRDGDDPGKGDVADHAQVEGADAAGKADTEDCADKRVGG